MTRRRADLLSEAASDIPKGQPNMISILLVAAAAFLASILLRRLVPGVPEPVQWAVMTFVVCAFAKPVTPIPMWRRMGAALFGAVVAAALGLGLLALWP